MKQRILPLLLVLASIGAYAGLLSRGDLEFVYDDNRFVKDNEAIRDMADLPEFFTDPSTADARGWSGIYRPLRTLDFAIDYSVVGTTEGVGPVRWYHLRNVLYHALATLLVFRLFQVWGADRRWAFLGALLFGLHPVQVEAVAWITSRADVLCLVLLLGVLLLHAKSRGYDRYLLGSTGLLVLALLAKEEAIMLPPLAILADFVFRDDRRLRATLKRWPVYLLYGILVGIYIFLWINRHHVHQGQVWKVDALAREVFPGQLLTMARGFVYYARLLILPVDLAQDYYLVEIGSPDVLTVVCAVVVLGSLVHALRGIFRGGSIFSFAVLWAFVAMIPTSNLLVPIGIPTAERFLYLPMVGIVFFCGALLRRVADSGTRGGVLAGIFFGCLFLVSFFRAQVWATGDALWSSTLRYDSPRAVEWFAEQDRSAAEIMQEQERELRDAGRFQEANRLRDQAAGMLEESVEAYNRAIHLWARITPSPEPQFKAQARQAVSLFALKRFEHAYERAKESVAHYPKMPVARFALSLALLGLGQERAAAVEIDRAIALHPRPKYKKAGAGIYEKLAEYYERKENNARAYQALKRSFELLPSEQDNPAVFRALRNAEARYLGDVEKLLAAIQSDPADGNSRVQLAALHAAFGNYAVAEPMFSSLMQPGQLDRHPAVLGPFALYFWQWRDTKEGYEQAIGIYRELLAADPGNTEVAEQIELCLKELAALPEEDR